jgi:hypothetical protein
MQKKTQQQSNYNSKTSQKIQLCSEKECSGGIILLKTTKDCHLNRYISLKIPKGQSEYAYRRGTDNTMAKRKRTKGQTTIYKTYT